MSKFRLLFKYLPAVIESAEHLDSLLDNELPVRDRSLALLDMIAVFTDETDTTIDDEVVAQVRGIIERDEFWATIDMIIDIFDGDGEPKVRLAGAHEASLDPATIMLLVELGAFLFKVLRERRKNRK